MQTSSKLAGCSERSGGEEIYGAECLWGRGNIEAGSLRIHYQKLENGKGTSNARSDLHDQGIDFQSSTLMHALDLSSHPPVDIKLNTSRSYKRPCLKQEKTSEHSVLPKLVYRINIPRAIMLFDRS